MVYKPTPEIVEVLLAVYNIQRDLNSPNKHNCEGAEFHSPRPLQVHGYRLSNGNAFWLCGTCKDNLDIYLYLWDHNKGLGWDVQRCFGAKIRGLANIVINSRKTEEQSDIMVVESKEEVK